MPTACFSIAAVERDTGLSKDVLRVWERRYGFPMPQRDGNGERLYPVEQVNRLRLIKRLMDQGHRPGKLLTLPQAQLAELAPRRPTANAVNSSNAGNAGNAEFAESTAGALSNEESLAELLALLKLHDAASYQQALQQRLARQGLQRFVQDTVAPMTQRVGEAWEDGSFEVFEEHLFTELTKRVLRQAISALPGGKRSPRILLTSVPEEQHVLGLLMAEGLFALEGAECIPLGTQMPLVEIGRAAQAHQVDIVALSFSTAFPQRQIGGLLRQLRQELAPEIALWVGGGGIARVAAMENVTLLATFDAALEALNGWRLNRDKPAAH